MIHYLTTLAQAAGGSGGEQVSVGVLTAVIAAIFSGVALLIGKMLGKREAAGMRLEEPVPTVPTRKVFNNVTWNDLQPIITRMDRLEKHLDDVRKEQSDQFREILEAGSTRSERLTSHMDDIARAIHSRIDDLMRDASNNHHHNQPKPPTRR